MFIVACYTKHHDLMNASWRGTVRAVQVVHPFQNSDTNAAFCTFTSSYYLSLIWSLAYCLLVSGFTLQVTAVLWLLLVVESLDMGI